MSWTCSLFSPKKMGRHVKLQRLSLDVVSGCFGFGSIHGRADPGSTSTRIVQKTKLLGRNGGDDLSSESGRSEHEIGNRVMIVVDSSLEAKGALEWTLSHAVQEQDSILLLRIFQPSKQGAEFDGRIDDKAYDLLLSLKSTCQLRRPEVQVEIIMVEGKEKGPVIVEEAKRNKASLLVLGQRKRSSFWRILSRVMSINGGTVEYCIQYSSCMAIAVRRKSQKLGGFLITTKTHKNFWLLA